MPEYFSGSLAMSILPGTARSIRGEFPLTRQFRKQYSPENITNVQSFIEVKVMNIFKQTVFMFLFEGERIENSTVFEHQVEAAGTAIAMILIKVLPA